MVLFLRHRQFSFQKIDCILKPEPDKPSLVVQASDGNFSNQALNLMALLYLKTAFNMKIFLPIKAYNILSSVFSDIQALPAEQYICNFTQNFQSFQKNWHLQRNTLILDFIREKENASNLTFPKSSDNGSYIFPQKYMEFEYISELTAHEKFHTPNKNSMPDWLVFSSYNLTTLSSKQKGHKIIVYSPGTYVDMYTV